MTVRSERVLVTGASGFLGSHLVRRLLSEGAEVHILARDSTRVPRLHEMLPKLVCWHGDVTNAESIVRCCQEARPQVIYHCAGDTTGRRFSGDWSLVPRSLAVNLMGTLDLLRAAASASVPPRLVVRVGGLEEYGTGPVPFTEYQREQPSSPYSASQVAATHWCQMLQPHLPFPVVTLRPALVYGPAQSADFLIPGLITSLLARRHFTVTARQQRRDLLYVEDFINAMRLAATEPVAGGTVLNISTGIDHAIGEVVTLIAALLGGQSLLEFDGDDARSVDIDRLVGDFEEAQSRLGWRPSTDLEQGLACTIDWYRNQCAAGRGIE